jgi:hypothetical protein
VNPTLAAWTLGLLAWGLFCLACDWVLCWCDGMFDEQVEA